MAKKKILTEAQICKLFNIDDRGLGKLRSEYKLPFIRVDRFRRLYYEHRIFEWLDQREQNIGSEGVLEGLSSDVGCIPSDAGGGSSDDWEEADEIGYVSPEN